MSAFDHSSDDTQETIGNSLRRRPLARKKLSEMVEEELEQMIRRGEFGEGGQLPSERELMAFFNVGRPSVREALAALKRKGLVQINNVRESRDRRRTPSFPSFPGWRRIFSPRLAVSRISSSYVFFSNQAWCAMRLRTPRMSRFPC